MASDTLLWLILLVALILLLVGWLVWTRTRKAGRDAASDALPPVEPVIPAPPLTPEAEAARIVPPADDLPVPPPVTAVPKPAPAAKPVQVEPAPVAAAPAVSTPAPTRAGEADNLLLLKGVGPKLNTLLGTLGVTRFDQIATWTAADIAKIDAQLGTFAGRIVRDNWVEQAKLLAAGDIAGFEAKFGAL